MENIKEQYPKKDKQSESDPTKLPVKPPEKEVDYNNLAPEIQMPSRPEIVKPDEQNENWNENMPKEGYDPSYPAQPDSSGTLL